VGQQPTEPTTTTWCFWPTKHFWFDDDRCVNFPRVILFSSHSKKVLEAVRRVLLASHSSRLQIPCLATWEGLERPQGRVVSVSLGLCFFVHVVIFSTGAFSNNNNSVGSVFGAPKPATGFGAFGGNGTSTFGGGTGAFGSGGTTSAFGQPSTSTNTGSVFGGGGAGIFGQNKGTSAFGSTTSESNFSV